MLPTAIYQRHCQAGDIQSDVRQLTVLPLLDNLYRQIQAEEDQQGWWHSLSQFFQSESIIPGLYLWGGVGRGKTYLMDLLYDALPSNNKVRLHFYRFMQKVHEQLQELQQKQTKNPLLAVAKNLRQQSRVLFFDEFFVSDVTDAMIMAELWQHLFEQGIILVATSNRAPDALYHNGVHRDRFLPVIDLIKKNTAVINLDGAIDYRLRYLSQAAIYYSPANESAEQQLAKTADDLMSEESLEDRRLIINNHEIIAKKRSHDVLWCDYFVLCREARSQYDYIELAKQFHTVLIANVPVFTAEKENEARRFISLVDEFYDRRVNLILSAEALPTALYQGRLLQFEFERTASRLIEMQSEDYLRLAHQP